MDRISNFSKKTWRDFIAENAELRAEITQLQCEVRDLHGVKKAFLQLCRQHYEERVILNDTIDKLTAERDWEWRGLSLKSKTSYKKVE